MHRSSRIVLTACAALLALAIWPPRAQAHGRFPELTSLAADPNGGGLVVTATFGLLTGDSSGRFEWICREVLGASLTEDPVFLRMGDGSLLGATFHGLVHSDDSGCSWQSPAGAPAGGVFIDVARDPHDPMQALAVTSAGGETNGLYRTTDGGASFAPTGDPIAPVLFERVRVAPSRAARIYLSGATPASATSPRTLWIYRSDDGGVSFSAFPVAGVSGLPAGNFDGARNLRLLAVDPTDADHLWGHVVRDPAIDGSADALVMSRDGGETFSALLTVANLGGFALSADGARAWVGARPDDEPGHTPGGPERGLWRSDDGGETFASVDSTLPVHCMSEDAGVLRVCADDATSAFAIGRSSDGGETFERFLALNEIAGMVRCAPDSPAALMCEAAWDDLRADLNIRSASGGGCSAGGGARPAQSACLLTLLALFWRRRRVTRLARPH